MKAQVVLFAAFLAVAELAPLEEVLIIPSDPDLDGLAEIPDYETLGPSKGIIMGDIEVDPYRNSRKDKQWLNGVVPYIIYDKYPQTVKDIIISAFRAIEYAVNSPGSKCIQFVPRKTEKDFINILPQTGCHAQVGRGPNHKVSIGRGCEAKNTVIHELLHALGFYHEMSRYDRDNYIEIDFNNIVDGQAYNYDKLKSATSDNLGVEYDFQSILHYHAYELAKDRSRPVMKPKPGKDEGQRMGSETLSTKDVLKIQRYYKCTENTTHISTNNITPDYLVNCNFAFGMCNLDTSGKAQWIATSKDVGGPHAGHTNGADKYLLVSAKGNNGSVAQITLPKVHGTMCLIFYVYQKGPTSYINLKSVGPRLPLQTIKTSKGYAFDKWWRFAVNFGWTGSSTVNYIIEAVMEGDDIAIDDLQFYLGRC